MLSFLTSKVRPFDSSVTILAIADSQVSTFDAFEPVLIEVVPMCLAWANTGSLRKLRPDMPVHCPANRHK